MYLEHFGLREYPFSLTPDTRFFFAYRQYQEALNTLLVAIRSGEGFVKITGEVGTGKSLLCRKFINTPDPQVYTAYIPNPFMTPMSLNLALAEELGLKLSASAGQHRVIKEITRRLISLHRDGKRVVLCIDEAQTIPRDTIEALRLLTNLETEQQKLLQVILFGQPELNDRLNGRSVRQLKQRITFGYHLKSMDLKGVESYLQHRLLAAGSNGETRFHPRAIRLLYSATRGTPRLVNILAHKGMMACYGQGGRVIRPSHMKRAIRDTDAAVSSGRWRRAALLAALALSAALMVGQGALSGVLP